MRIKGNIVDVTGSFVELVKKLIPGHSHLSSTAYDTAWIARLKRLDKWMAQGAIDWLYKHQLSNGGWGAEWPIYYHDRFIATLSAMAALASLGQVKAREWQQCQSALLEAMSKLSKDSNETIGFEMIAPILVNEVRGQGAFIPNDGLLTNLAKRRRAKLSASPGGVISRFVTLSFSAEMAGLDGRNLLDLENIQEKNGSVAYSPSATAYYALISHNHAALEYLLWAIEETGDGSLPSVAPSDVFEIGWVLWNLELSGQLDETLQKMCQPLLDWLESNWTVGQGIPHVAGYDPRDSDDTSLVYLVLSRFGRSVDIETILEYEENNWFRCFGLEANPSISANIHVLAALRQADFSPQHPAVQKISRFLLQSQTVKLFWFDKWHASPFYATSHAIIACAGYMDELVADAVYWIRKAQNTDGSWGYYDRSTAEETAYCLQALATWKQKAGEIDNNVLIRGKQWLVEQLDKPYPPLWISKSLYCPTYVVRSAILSALSLAGGL
jgi:halimadienyl-diphosphate synthase